MDILWPRWVARIGVTRATEACFLTADRQCTELPLLRLPRLVHGFRGSDPMRQTRDLARVGWRGLAARKGCVRSRDFLMHTRDLRTLGVRSLFSLFFSLFLRSHVNDLGRFVLFGVLVADV